MKDTVGVLTVEFAFKGQLPSDAVLELEDGLQALEAHLHVYFPDLFCDSIYGPLGQACVRCTTEVKE